MIKESITLILRKYHIFMKKASQFDLVIKEIAWIKHHIFIKKESHIYKESITSHVYEESITYLLFRNY